MIKRLLIIAALCLTAVCGRAQMQAAAVADTTSTAVGTMLGATIGRIVSDFESAGVVLDRSIVAKAAERAIGGSYTGLTLEQAQDVVNGILAGIQPMAGVDSFDTASQVRFLDEAAARDGAVRTASGVVLEVITEGEGPMPAATSRVRVSYVGRLSDDTIFDATDDPVVFPVGDLTPGLSEALTMMRPGGKYRVTIPSEQAYGEEGIPGVIPGRAALQFNIELLDILPADIK